VTANDSFFQKQRPAAVLKHAVLNEYLRVFTSMVGSRRVGPVWFIDGYAGPGSYAATSDVAEPTAGSPLVAMRLARSLHFSGQRDLRCAFIESDHAYATELRNNLDPFGRAGLNPVVLEGSVEDELPRAWKLVSGAPVITFLDPFGVNTVPVGLMARLLARGRPTPSEVLLNINVEAVGRLGGCLEERGGVITPKPGLEKSVDRVDRFFGNTSWRVHFYQVRNSPMATAASAAESVIARYRQDMARTTGYASMSVPIRRRPGNSPLFHLTLFYRQGVAGYKFADAARRATRKWRDVFRAEELAEATAVDEDTLFDVSAEIKASLEDQAERQEKAMSDEWVTIIKKNIRSLLATQGKVGLAEDIGAILGTTLSLAGEPEIRRAWDQLAAEGAVRPRDKSQRAMYRLQIISTR
jgi:three-Cys-motif partner protein